MWRTGADRGAAATGGPSRRDQMILDSINDIIMALAVMSIPIVAMIGGLTLAIIKIIGRQRLEELARRERIAAIERGMDPSKLPAARSL